MRAKRIFAGIFGLGMIIAALGGAWYFALERPLEYCRLSGRLIRPHMLTTVGANGTKLYACWARCALTYEQRTGKLVEIVSVTDCISGREIDAGKEYFLSGSRVEPCCSPALRREEVGTPYVRIFDRCSPSLPFAHQEQARAFMDENEVVLTTLNELQPKVKFPDHGVSSSRSLP